MEKLNERQQALYNFLLGMSSSGEYVSKEVICDVLFEFYTRHLERTSEHNSAAYCLIRQDVRAINFSNVEKIIVSSKKGYKIATKEEAEHYVKRRLKKNLVSMKLYWNIKNKIDRNGQLDLELHEIETFIGGM